MDPAVSHWRVQAARRLPSGAWSAPVHLSGPNDSAYTPEVGIDAHGTATTMWRDIAGSYYVIMASRQPAGGSWSSPESLSLPSLEASDQHLAVNARGDAAVDPHRIDRQGRPH
jgi:hypothetical protein